MCRELTKRFTNLLLGDGQTDVSYGVRIKQLFEEESQVLNGKSDSAWLEILFIHGWRGVDNNEDASDEMSSGVRQIVLLLT